MPKWLLRIVGLLLAFCLIVDPGMASARAIPLPVTPFDCTTQALSAAGQWYVNFPFQRILNSRSRRWAAGTLYVAVGLSAWKFQLLSSHFSLAALGPLLFDKLPMKPLATIPSWLRRSLNLSGNDKAMTGQLMERLAVPGERTNMVESLASVLARNGMAAAGARFLDENPAAGFESASTLDRLSPVDLLRPLVRDAFLIRAPTLRREKQILDAQPPSSTHAATSGRKPREWLRRPLRAVLYQGFWIALVLNIGILLVSPTSAVFSSAPVFLTIF